MPYLSVSKSKSLININLFTRKEVLRHVVIVHTKEQLVCISEGTFLKNLIQTIGKYKVGSLDTEGKPVTALVIGDIEGRVLAINNLAVVGIPIKLKKLIEDSDNTWIQSNVEEDVQQLSKFVNVKTYVDSALIYRTCVADTESNKFGRGVQAEYLGQTNFPYCTKNEANKIVFLCKFGQKNWHWRECLHVAQDVQVPIAIALQCTIEYMSENGYIGSDNLLPFLYNFLASFINISNDAVHRGRRFKPEQRSWLPIPASCRGQDYPKCCENLNSLSTVAQLRLNYRLFCTDMKTPMFADPPKLSFGEKHS